MEQKTRLPAGLSSKEAGRLLLQYGENMLESKKKTSALRIFAGQFRDLMVLILLAATAVSALLGEVGEALAIVAIVLLNALLGFFQELRTEKTLEALAKMAAPGARVIRDGETQEISASLVVPGDLLLLETGDRIAADGMILAQSALSCDESMLTGESEPAEKSTASDRASDGAARDARVFMGTSVTSGHGTVRVTATGMSTEMGAIAGMLEEIEEEPTPLQRRLNQLGKTIGTGCMIICTIVAMTGILRGEDPFSMLITGISLAVAAVPEGLPAIVTISLALAVRRILRRNALIKRLHAVETLGCATVVCSDKTGTLTENKMALKRLATLSGAWSLEGADEIGSPEMLRAVQND
ncbi:MAG: HAD-IC family P-type ATPase, partial [Oscillospiraceae bacterium]